MRHSISRSQIEEVRKEESHYQKKTRSPELPTLSNKTSFTPRNRFKIYLNPLLDEIPPQNRKEANQQSPVKQKKCLHTDQSIKRQLYQKEFLPIVFSAYTSNLIEQLSTRPVALRLLQQNNSENISISSSQKIVPTKKQRYHGSLTLKKD